MNKLFLLIPLVLLLSACEKIVGTMQVSQVNTILKQCEPNQGLVLIKYGDQRTVWAKCSNGATFVHELKQ